MNTRRIVCKSLAIGVIAPAMFPSSRAHANVDWKPDRPVRFIVPFAAGGGSDTFARLISDPVTQQLGQPLVVENKPGAGGIVAADFVAKSPGDGYTLLMATPGTQLINPWLFKNLPYDADAFVPVGPLFEAPNILVVHPGVAAHSVAELIALAKQMPGQLNFSSAGLGATSHLSGELFKLMAQVDIMHVPYRGTGPALNDLIAGRVQMAIDSITGLLAHIRSGALRALGVASQNPHPSLPGLPTIAETVPGFESGSINYVLAPPGTPQNVIQTLASAFRAALAEPTISHRIADMGFTAMTETLEQLGARIRRDQNKWKHVIETAGITV